MIGRSVHACKDEAIQSDEAEKMRAWTIIAALVAFSPTVHAAVIADTDTTLICAVVDLASCAPGDGCRRETADSMNAPQLVTVDRKESVIKASRPNGDLLATTIDRTSEDQGLLVLDGVQDALSWTMTIVREGGQMSLSAVGDSQALVVFGRCEPK
jgi:hypothetical protein